MDPANELRENDYSMGDSNSEIKTVLQALNRHFTWSFIFWIGK